MKYINTVLAIILAFLLAFSVTQSIKNDKLNEKYQIAISNNKAYENQLTEQKIAFQFEVGQLKYINDRSVYQLDSLRNELKIKDNKIKQMSKTKEYVYIHDSITVHDTLFCDTELDFDTCMGDKWYKSCIHLKFPNEIDCNTSINLEQDCFLYTSRETIDPPKKTWIGRLFQKKHDVYNITIVEHNPYANIQENKFIIIK